MAAQTNAADALPSSDENAKFDLSVIIFGAMSALEERKYPSSVISHAKRGLSCQINLTDSSFAAASEVASDQRKTDDDEAKLYGTD